MNTNLGMTYLEKVAHGNAGEFYFAYWISNKFVWPCRILDIDMGLDAQVEIYDDNNHSTGMFIGVQVKATGKTLAQKPSVSIPLKNIVYWESIDNPMVLIRVCLNNNKRHPTIYWKHLDKEKLSNYINSGNENITITFNKEDILTINDKENWISLFITPDEMKFIKNIEAVRNKIEFYYDYFLIDSSTSTSEYDRYGLSGDNFFHDINNIFNAYDNFQSVIDKNPRLIILSKEVSELNEYYERNLQVIEDSVYSLIKNGFFKKRDFETCLPINPIIQNWFI